MGLIEKIVGNPNRYRAIPVQDCLSILMEERKSKTIKLKQKLKVFLQESKDSNQEKSFADFQCLNSSEKKIA
jgi:sugar-specific transcriptional regulator TrmB